MVIRRWVAHLRKPDARDLGIFRQLPELAHPGLEQRPLGLRIICRVHAVHKVEGLPAASSTHLQSQGSLLSTDPGQRLLVAQYGTAGTKDRKGDSKSWLLLTCQTHAYTNNHPLAVQDKHRFSECMQLLIYAGHS